MENDIWDEFNKIFAPIVLFICTPVFAISGYIVTAAEFERGGPSSYGPLIGIVILVLSSAVFGIFACKRAFGWFSKNRRNGK